MEESWRPPPEPPAEIAYQNAQIEFKKLNPIRAFVVDVFATLAGIFGRSAYKTTFTWLVTKLSDSNPTTQTAAKSVDEATKKVFPNTNEPQKSKGSFMDQVVKGAAKDIDIPSVSNPVVNKVVKEQIEPFFYDMSPVESRHMVESKTAGAFLVRLSSAYLPDRVQYTLDFRDEQGVISKRFGITEDGKICSYDFNSNILDRFETFADYLKFNNLNVSDAIRMMPPSL